MLRMMKTDYQIAIEVLAGQWGNGEERKQKLTAAGYDYAAVQKIVNDLVASGYVPPSGAPDPKEPELLEVDFDTLKYKGIQINIII